MEINNNKDYDGKGISSQKYLLQDKSVIKSVVYINAAKNNLNYFLKYFLNEKEISREIFDQYKMSLNN
ncbi:hypothetical protein [Sphingobacterium bovisgrunnientis]|uniref:hypothetical protein n=1 Tax=Sphingobacterium bovisgrunnientis TaxID=1874697 RepID=UPI0013572AB2|nr:hypothetical protein [Sphingobacterium bovisgrunnientis]